MPLIEQWIEGERAWSREKFIAENRKYLLIYLPLMAVGVEALIALLAVFNHMPIENMKRNLLYGLVFCGIVAGVIILFIIMSMLFGGAKRHMRNMRREMEKQLPTQWHKEEFARQMLRPEEILLHREMKVGGLWIKLDISSDYICYRTHTIVCGIVRLRDTEEMRTDVDWRYYSVGTGTGKQIQSASVYPIKFFYTGNTTIDDRNPKPDALIYVPDRQMQIDIVDIMKKREENLK